VGVALVRGEKKNKNEKKNILEKQHGVIDSTDKN